MKRLCSLCLLLCLLLLLFLTACARNSDGPAVNTAPADEVGGEVETSALDTLPTADLRNEEFLILSSRNPELVEYEDTSTPLSKAAYDRTQFINDHCNCELKMEIIDHTFDSIQNNHLGGGSKGYDLVIAHVEQGLSGTLTGGFCADLLSVNNLSLDGDWYRAEQIKNYQANGMLFILSTDFTIQGEGMLSLVYNKALYQALGGTADLYQVVNDGDWTLDYCLTELKNLNVTGYDSATDTHGTYAFSCNYKLYPRFFYEGGNIQTAAMGDGNQWTLTYNTTENMERMDKVLAAAHDFAENVVYFEDYIQEGTAKRAWWNVEIVNSNMINFFLGQKSVFMIWDIGSIYQSLLDADFDIGYLPAPKTDTQQQSYTIDGVQAPPTLIPSVLTDEKREESGAVLEALTRYSYLKNRPVFFETIIGGRMSEHPEDYEAIARIFDTKYYCIVELFAGDVFAGVMLSSRTLPESASTYVNGQTPVFKSIMQTVNSIGNPDSKK